MSTDRQAQIDKIQHYVDSDDSTNVCHSWTGKTIKARQNPTDYVVLCGIDHDTIYHSFLVNSNGNNLVPKDSGYINPNISLDDTECEVTLAKTNTTQKYPYMDTIKASEFI
jgi:hypothetical protein